MLAASFVGTYYRPLPENSRDDLPSGRARVGVSVPRERSRGGAAAIVTLGTDAFGPTQLHPSGGLLQRLLGGLRWPSGPVWVSGRLRPCSLRHGARRRPG